MNSKTDIFFKNWEKMMKNLLNAIHEFVGFWLTKSITNEDRPDWIDDSKNCCEEEIIRRGNDGFTMGDTIQTKLKADCTTAEIDVRSDNMKLRLSGWGYYNVSFCNALSHIKIKGTTFQMQPIFRNVIMISSVPMIS